MIKTIFDINFRFKDIKGKYSSFFDWYRFTIPSKYRKGWEYEDGIGIYEVKVDEGLISKQKDDWIKQTLIDVNNYRNTIEIQSNDGTMKLCKNEDDKTVYKYGNYVAVFSNYLWNKLSLLFINTYITQSCDSIEGLTIRFDFDNKKALITEIVCDVPDEDDKLFPYYDFARKVAMHTTFKMVTNDNVVSNDKKVNFYDTDRGTEWKGRKTFEDMLENKEKVHNVIYMLYDNEKGYFYVGKANELVARLNQHIMGEKDRMRDFTHFRYTPVNDLYAEEYLYLIENTAIHDCAAIFNMPNGRKYKDRDLETHIFSGQISKYIQITNDVEKQTK